MKKSFLHNTKLSASKYNKEKARSGKLNNSHTNGRVISLTEMLHNMLKYSEISTDMIFIDIATTFLETRINFSRNNRKETTTINNQD